MKTLGFRRVAVASPELRIADIEFNVSQLVKNARDTARQDADLTVFPELSLTGYSCGDLFYQSRLRQAALEGLDTFCKKTASLPGTFLLGLPIEFQCRLYNAVAVIQHGEILGVVPKTFLPNRNEFYEARWFSSGKSIHFGEIQINKTTVPFSPNLLFEEKKFPAFCLGIEICEDLWAVEPPSGKLALSGATILANPSASPEQLGKLHYRKNLVIQQSARCLAAYLYAAAGPCESTSDIVFSGHNLVVENGRLLGESPRFHFESTLLIRDIDCEFLTTQRFKNTPFSLEEQVDTYFRRISLAPTSGASKKKTTSLLRSVSPHPFVPENASDREANCSEIFEIQATALARRLRHTGLKNVLIGISGGLDSTLALLVCIAAFRKLGLPPEGIIGISMPGPGTSERTRKNALALLKKLKVTGEEISIVAAIKQHFKDIGQNTNKHDLTYENAQARERTQILMDLANKRAALVVGTGDLSEAALGWCTFNGDHMSMYHVNIGVPKTLVRYLVEWYADLAESRASGISKTLLDIAATPISPELLPPDRKGKLRQKTEDLIGPYELHDFFLYHAIHCGAQPEKTLFLAKIAFAKKYSSTEIKRWLQVFLKRFFSQQFKRNAMPDGPKVGTVALSPRGDWRMPSEASPNTWL
ncbi:MAG: NAD(+) synthase [Chthoniobacterales bacterium]